MKSWREAILPLAALPEAATLLCAAEPAWIWSRDGSRVLWANPAGGARLGAAKFDEIWNRRWPKGHPLRREMEALARTLPDKGALGRLRLADDLRAVPIPCRCRRIRAGDERGVLVVGLDGPRVRPSLADLARFFSDDLVGATLLDETGAVVDGEEPEPAGDENAPWAQIAFADGERPLRLCLSARARAPEHPTSAEPDGTPVADNGSAAIEQAPEESPPTSNDIEAADRVPPPAADQAAPGRIETAPAVVDEGSPGPRNGARVNGLRPVVRAQLAPPVKQAPEETAPEIAGEPPPRAISAGRVARELSRKPVRFLWQTDGADRFLFVSPGLAQVVGRNAEIVGERWQDAATRLRLDPAARIGRALAQRDTWSGHTAWWPIEGSNVRVPAELTALPIFGIDHSFQGYRGFGVLKPAEALMPAAFEARFGPPGAPAEQMPPYEEAVATTPANVVPIRADLERAADHTRLTPQERNAFEEIAAALRQRVLDGPVHDTMPDAEGVPEPVASDRSDDLPATEEKTKSPSVVELFPEAAPEAALPAGQTAVDEPAESDEPTIEVPAVESTAEDTVPEKPARPRAEAAPVGAADHTAVPPEGAAESELPEIEAEPRGAQAAERRAATRAKFSESETQRRLREMTAILDTATDGVIVLDGNGTIESLNASAEALFGLEAHEMQGTDFGELLTPESRQSALDYLSGLRDNGVASLLNEGREVEAVAGAGTIPLFMTMGRISSEAGGRFCAVLRDITHWKRTEAELVAARRAAEAASNQKSEFLARVSHEIRTPLNAIIGFAEVMIEERFGPVENDRYREYLRDIRMSGEHVVSLVNDLLDISKIEAGKLDLNFQAVPLNELVRECIALMQPQANRAHVVLRSSVSKEVPAIVADQRTLRQIVLNLLSNSVKFTAPGGQVIASTSLAESGEALLRIRDTGEGMSEEELARALEPFRQIATATLSDRNGTGLGLPLTKALVEANRASLAIRSARGEGTVVTITFPPTRVLSE